MTSLSLKFERLQDEVNSEIYERSREVHTAVLAMLAKKHHFQIGPPGTAKSLLVERLVKRIGNMPEDGYFRWLLTNHTVPEELFGGPDFTLLREKGIYKRVTTGKAPRALFFFADEIFKANSSILNANLTLMNERKFFNADDNPNVPLISMYAASNEMPQGDALWALWDRLHFRHEIGPMRESTSFIKMMMNPIEGEPEPILDMEDLINAQAAVHSVVIPTDVFEALKTLRDELGNEGVYATERRWVECVGIIKAEAFMNGREVADIEDTRPLMHTLWADLDHQRIVKKKVLELANPIDKAASDVLDRLLELEHEFKEAVTDGDNPKQIAKSAIEIQGKIMKTKEIINELKKRSSESGRKSEYLDEAATKFITLAKSVMREGFNTDVDELNE